MTVLMAERRDLGEEGRQESLFEAPPSPRARWAEPEPSAPPWTGAEPQVPAAPPWAEVEPSAHAASPPAPLADEVGEQDEHARLEAFAPETVAPFEATVDPVADEPFAAPATDEVGERREPRSAGVPLAGPTLDDVMSRVWEGLATGLPAACPICHGEVEPTMPSRPLAGRCRSCGTMID
ncbi:MAG TPA: hypothetical protein VFZ00_26070 [Solirubrobacter sp.]|nr:hypothetical protein [Solirubrobacter sp.]